MEREMEPQITNRLKNVYVVSDNIISSLGFTTDENFQSLMAGRTGICRHTDPSVYPEVFSAALIDSERLSKQQRASGLEGQSKVESLVILSILEALRTAWIDMTDPRSLLILSTTKGNVSSLSGKIPPEQETYLWHTSQTVAGYFRMKTTPVVMSNACVSGVASIELASRLLKADLYDQVVIVGVDCITEFVFSGFHSFRSLSEEPCKPYDLDRNGLSLGEGAGTIILTNDATKVPGEKHIRILGGASSNDANHISAPSRTGDGLHYAIENAIEYAGIKKKDIDFINLHGTATIFNDEMESKALGLSGLSKVPANSLKGYFGHTLGASGIIETIICIESIRKNRRVATLGFSRSGVPESMNIIANNDSVELHTFIKTASGFGGFNSAIVVSDQPSYIPLQRYSDQHSYRVTSSCRIADRQVILNHSLAFENKEAENYSDFIKSAFRNLESPYMKFFKMDGLCKLGYTAVQYLLKDKKLRDRYIGRNISVLFHNSSSSLDSDIKHQQSITDKGNYYPHPAVFVYTLPNIVIGEICIQEKIQGEPCFLIFENKESGFVDIYLNLLFQMTKTEVIIAGRVECLGENYEASVFLIEKSVN